MSLLFSLGWCVNYNPPCEDLRQSVRVIPRHRLGLEFLKILHMEILDFPNSEGVEWVLKMLQMASTQLYFYLSNRPPQMC